jgi:hypothetical protein
VLFVQGRCLLLTPSAYWSSNSQQSETAATIVLRLCWPGQSNRYQNRDLDQITISPWLRRGNANELDPTYFQAYPSSFGRHNTRQEARSTGTHKRILWFHTARFVGGQFLSSFCKTIGKKLNGDAGFFNTLNALTPMQSSVSAPSIPTSPPISHPPATSTLYSHTLYSCHSPIIKDCLQLSASSVKGCEIWQRESPEIQRVRDVKSRIHSTRPVRAAYIRIIRCGHHSSHPSTKPTVLQ